MGCTSSTPNMLEVQTNKETTDADKTSDATDCKDDDELINIKSNSELKNINVDEIAVLPTCDSLDENIQLDRNIKTLDNAPNEESKSDGQPNSTIEHEKVKSEIPIEQQQEHNKFSSLKEVADQVFLISILDDLENTAAVNEEESLNKEKNEVENIEETPVELEAFQGEEIIESKEDEECSEETSSPSQSDGNRSTRWEALADIAAELPPSLAVDPITGQIYTLTK